MGEQQRVEPAGREQREQHPRHRVVPRQRVRRCTARNRATARAPAAAGEPARISGLQPAQGGDDRHEQTGPARRSGGGSAVPRAGVGEVGDRAPRRRERHQAGGAAELRGTTRCRRRRTRPRRPRVRRPRAPRPHAGSGEPTRRCQPDQASGRLDRGRDPGERAGGEPVAGRHRDGRQRRAGSEHVEVRARDQLRATAAGWRSRAGGTSSEPGSVAAIRCRSSPAPTNTSRADQIEEQHRERHVRAGDLPRPAACSAVAIGP